MKTLLLMRHAKSDWSNPTLSDHHRPLNKRGHKAAKRMGQWLKTNQLIPQYVICSTSTRTMQTLALVQQSIDIPEKHISYSKDLYLATHSTLLDTLLHHNHNHTTTMLLSHNPGLEDFLISLYKPHIKPTVNGKILPTGSIAVIDYEIINGNLESELRGIARPKEVSV